jgi:D-aminoacyl-tRNA deacylase
MTDYMKEALKKLKSAYSGDEFEIVQECTHHGPQLSKPCMFIEIGSSETEWKRRDAGEIIANAVNFIAINPPKKHKSVIVLGGGHYNQVATKLMLNTEYSVGHICPKHMLTKLDEKMMKQAIDKNGERFEMAVLDWKGMSTEKQRIVEMLKSHGIKHEKYQSMNKEESSEE